MSSCPFAKILHEKSTDKHPSFSVRIDGSGKSVGHCFACNSSGSLWKLAKLYDDLFGGDVLDFVKKNENYDRTAYTKDPKSFGRRMDLVKARWLMDAEDLKAEIKHHEVEAFDEDKIESIEWKSIDRYLKSIPLYVINRGVSKETAKIWRLGYHKLHKSVMMPVVDRRNRLVGTIKGSIDPNRNTEWPKYLYNTGFMKSWFLYGENLVKEERGDLVLVEGPFDSLKIYEAGFNVGGVMGSFMSEIQALKAIDLVPKGRRIVLMFDNDKAGEKLMEQAYLLLKDRATVVKRVIPRIKKLISSNGVDEFTKDPGDLTSKQIRDLILTNECK